MIITTTVENLPEALKFLKEELQDIKAPTKPRESKTSEPNHSELIAPEPITTSEAREAYANAYDSAIEATPEIAAIVDDLNRVIELKEKLLTHEDKLKVTIMNYMQLHSKLTFNDKCLASWKRHTRSSFDLTSFKTSFPDMYDLYQKESSNRVFRLG